jgi:hypothetical protein
MLLEKRIDSKFGGRPDYERYKRETSVLLLWPRRSKGSEGSNRRSVSEPLLPSTREATEDLSQKKEHRTNTDSTAASEDISLKD